MYNGDPRHCLYRLSVRPDVAFFGLREQERSLSVFMVDAGEARAGTKGRLTVWRMQGFVKYSLFGQLIPYTASSILFVMRLDEVEADRWAIRQSLLDIYPELEPSRAFPPIDSPSPLLGEKPPRVL